VHPSPTPTLSSSRFGSASSPLVAHLIPPLDLFSEHWHLNLSPNPSAYRHYLQNTPGCPRHGRWALTISCSSLLDRLISFVRGFIDGSTLPGPSTCTCTIYLVLPIVLTMSEHPEASNRHLASTGQSKQQQQQQQEQQQEQDICSSTAPSAKGNRRKRPSTSSNDTITTKRSTSSRSRFDINKTIASDTKPGPPYTVQRSPANSNNMSSINLTKTGRVSKAKKGLKVHDCDCGRVSSLLLRQFIDDRSLQPPLSFSIGIIADQILVIHTCRAFEVRDCNTWRTII
jgi:hypothetical protein